MRKWNVHDYTLIYNVSSCSQVIFSFVTMYLCYEKRKKKSGVRLGTPGILLGIQGQVSKFETSLGSMRPRFGGREGHVGKREEAVWRCVLGMQEALGSQYCGKINYNTGMHSIHSVRRGTLVSPGSLDPQGILLL